MIKKLLPVVLAIGAALVVKKKIDQQTAEQNLWQEATAPVGPVDPPSGD
ncbi:MAG: DLW-39 family protein [Nostocoides sp.]